MDGTGIGASVVRREDHRLLTGTGCYADDVNLPGQAYAVFVRSPHAHADIVAIDVATAASMPGVVAVFTGADLVAGGLQPIPTLIAERCADMRNRDGTPFAEIPWHPLAPLRVRHAGEPVAMVVGSTPAIAADAAERVAVTWAPRAVVTEARSALAAGAAQLHDHLPGNRAYDWECGDAAATAQAIARAAHVARLTLVDNRLVTCFMEPRAALAAWDGERYTVRAGLQSVHALSLNLGRMLGVPTDRVRSVSGDVGGGFGTKIQTYPEYAAITWAARALDRPVKWTSSRIEGFVSDAHSRDHVLAGELALDADGRITALRVHSVTNIGAYCAPCIPSSTLSNMERMISSLYAIPAIHLRVEGACTNTVPLNVYRGVGRLECVYTVERLIGEAARGMGLDPVAIRHRNMIAPDAYPYRTATGAMHDSGDLRARMAEVLILGDAAGFAARRAQSATAGRLRGLAVGPYIEGTGGVPHEFAEVHVCGAGTVDVPIGANSQGQSHETVFAQIVADRLGVPFEAVRIVAGDTDLVARGFGTFASRSLVKAGGAAVEVSDMVIDLGRGMAAHLLEASPADLEYRDGAYRVTGTDRRVSLFDVARAAEEGRVESPAGRRLAASKVHENPAFAFANGCALCEVEVDPETGGVAIVAFSVVDDSGCAINPMVVHGQMHGAVAQGVGQALTERTVFDPSSGQLLSGSFMDYAIPRADELPSIPVVSRDVPSPTNALAAKGAGEGGTVAAPGAVMHAILDALAPLGVRHLDMPATPERVWRAIHAPAR